MATPTADQPGNRRYPGPVLRMAADYGWRLLIVGAVIYFAVELLLHLATVVIPLLIALLVTALLRPVLTFLRRRRLPRPLATLVTVLFAAVLLGGILTLVVVRAAEQAPQLGNQINKLIPHVQNWLVHGPLQVNPTTVKNLSRTLTNDITKNTSAVASTALSTGKAVIDLLTGLVLTLFITVFLLYDGEGVWSFVLHAVPAPARQRAGAAGRAAWETVSHYVQGTLLIAAFHGIVIFVTLTILGVPLALPLAVLVALGSFVPLIGAIVAGAVAAVVAGLAVGLVAAIVVAGVLLLDNQIEGHVLQPLVVGRYVRIHPLAVVLALASGAILFGIFGAIVAVPVAACVNSAARAALAEPESPQLPAMDPSRPGGDESPVDPPAEPA